MGFGCIHDPRRRDPWKPWPRVGSKEGGRELKAHEGRGSEAARWSSHNSQHRQRPRTGVWDMHGLSANAQVG